MTVEVDNGVEVDVMVETEVLVTNVETIGGVMVLVITTVVTGVTTTQWDAPVTVLVNVEPATLVVIVSVFGCTYDEQAAEITSQKKLPNSAGKFCLSQKFSSLSPSFRALSLAWADGTWA